MESVNEQLLNLEEDGVQYAHFLTHPHYPDYYGLWIRERTAEYVSIWLPGGPLAAYSLAFSIEMPDVAFYDYIAEIFTEQVPVDFINALYRIDDVSEPQKWVHDFKAWKQEKIRIERSQMLEQYPWVINPPDKLF